MRLSRRVAALVALATGAAALSGCTVERGRANDRVSECAKVRLEVEPVRGMTTKDVVLRARLTTGGEPLAGQVVELSLRESMDKPILWSQGGRTAKDGTVAVDLADAVRRFRIAQQAFAQSRLVQGEFRNPAESKQVPPPGWCSEKVTAPFEPVR